MERPCRFSRPCGSICPHLQCPDQRLQEGQVAGEDPGHVLRHAVAGLVPDVMISAGKTGMQHEKAMEVKVFQATGQKLLPDSPRMA